MRVFLIPLIVVWSSCARVDVYYPSDGKDVVIDDRGRPHRGHGRALVLNGTDSLGNTVIDVTRNGVRFASAGGLDSSTTTLGWQRTIRHGVGTAAGAAVLGIGLSQAANAYSANQAQVGVSSAAASRAAAATAASKSATTIKLAEIAAAKEAAAAAAAKALPAAGSTIQATIPAVVTP